MRSAHSEADPVREEHTGWGAHERRAPPRPITELVEVQERTSALRQAQGPGARYSAFDSRRIPASVSICFACDV